MRPEAEYLRHILDELVFVESVTEDLTREAFIEDAVLKRAVVRSLEVIGEATKRLPTAFRDRHLQVNWRALAGMRDRLIHGYFGVDYDIVWDAAKHHLPVLERDTERLLEEA